MNFFKKLYRTIKYRKVFAHPSGMKFNSYKDFLDFIESPRLMSKNDFIKFLKKNTYRWKIYFNESYLAIPNVLIFVSKKKLKFIEKEVEKYRIMGICVHYKALKWHEGWFPRCKILICNLM